MSQQEDERPHSHPSDNRDFRRSIACNTRGLCGSPSSNRFTRPKASIDSSTNASAASFAAIRCDALSVAWPLLARRDMRDSLPGASGEAAGPARVMRCHSDMISPRPPWETHREEL